LSKSLQSQRNRKIVFKKFPDPSKKIKNATHSRHSMTQKLNTDNGLQGRTDRTPAGNSGFAKKRVQWLIEHSTSHQTFLCRQQFYVDSFDNNVIRNPLLRKAAKFTLVMTSQKSKDQEGQPLSSKECNFCHIEAVRLQWEADIKKQGYFIIEMENCN
jgi:hypothetical protein